MPKGVHNGHRANSGSFSNLTPEQRADLYQRRSESKRYQETRRNSFDKINSDPVSREHSMNTAYLGRTSSAYYSKVSSDTLKRLRENTEFEENRKQKAAEGLRRTLWGRTRSLPTIYAGIKFRSRTEARFAEWCDRVGWNWVYEPCVLKYDTKEGLVKRYIPDFYIFNEDLYVELKGWKFDGLRETLDMIEEQNGVSIQLWTTAFIEELMSL